MAKVLWPRSAPALRFAGLALTGLLVLIAAVMIFRFSPPVRASDPVATALRSRLDRPPVAAWIKTAYAERGFRPLWSQGSRLSPLARAVVKGLARADDDGLDPRTYGADGLSRLAARADVPPAVLAEADIELTEDFGRYVADLHGAHDPQPIFYADAALKPALADPRTVAQGATHAPSLQAYVAQALRMNPIYVELRDALRRDHGAPTGLVRVRAGRESDGEAELLRANMDRVRGLPANLGSRYVLVNIAAQRLWYFDHGQPAGSMRVIVGKPSEQTPQMAGLIRYMVARPYWNIPPDLVRDSVAPKVIAQGAAYLQANDFEALSDWSDKARVLDPASVDWAAVAAGRQELRMRQRPGPRNMMGEVKFMFPNALGVYLHDTPLKALFEASPRTHSAGCVRLEHARQLARWLNGGAPEQLAQPGGAEQPLELARPVPVYLLYLTAEAGDGGRLDLAEDVYHRDPPWTGTTTVANTP